VRTRPLVPRRRRRRPQQLRNSLGLGGLLVVLTAVNIYFFFLRHDTSVRTLMTASTAKSLEGVRQEAMTQLIPPSLLGAAYDAKKQVKLGAQTTQPLADDGALLGQFGPADTLSVVLAREGFANLAGAVSAALAKLVDPKLIRAGEKYQVDRDDEGNPRAFEYMPTPVLHYSVTQKPDGSWQAKKQEKALEIKTVEAFGGVDSSLYESVSKAGEGGALVSLMVDLFAWDINFYTDTHPGDHWKVVVEKQYLGGQFYRYGRLLAAEYGGKVGTFRGFYWNPTGEHGRGRYYDEKGQALAKTMLKTPLRFVRISSKFDRQRFHPILHVVKAHLGVDCAAPQGTPVWASMGGKVLQAEMMRGSGNTIVIAHGNGLQTRYYHLCRFAKNLRAGKQVQQKEVIGYVGMTGLATGPHLHFSVVKNGQFIDPAKVSVMREPGPSNRAAFLAAIRPRLAALKALPAVMAKN
jgi:murein DD-endopeptidase MepM/ murein hydrolase activator NlpD